jgi:hypothetical protein
MKHKFEQSMTYELWQQHHNLQQQQELQTHTIIHLLERKDHVWIWGERLLVSLWFFNSNEPYYDTVQLTQRMGSITTDLWRMREIKRRLDTGPFIVDNNNKKKE